MIRFILIILITSLVYACKESIPSAVIKPKKMQQVLWDVLKAEALADQMVKADSNKSQTSETKKLLSQVFKIHKITKAQFDTSYNYYINHPDIMRGIFDSLSTQQTRMLILPPPLPKKIILDSLKKQ